jgi:cell division septum initiation protein DivIVA
VKNAQAEADKVIGEAQASFDKLREDYRHRVASDLVDVDRRIDLLSAKAGMASTQRYPSRDRGLIDTLR